MPASRFAIGQCRAISVPRPAPIGKLNFAERWDGSLTRFAARTDLGPLRGPSPRAEELPRIVNTLKNAPPPSQPTISPGPNPAPRACSAMAAGWRA